MPFLVLTASVCRGTRSIPVAVSACHKWSLARSQNLWEVTFLRLSVDRLRVAGVEAVWLRADRLVGVRLIGVALLLWTSVGRAVEESEPQVRLVSRTKGARLSLARVGSYYWLKVSKQLRLTAKFVREHLPPPRLRMFK